MAVGISRIENYKTAASGVSFTPARLRPSNSPGAPKEPVRAGRPRGEKERNPPSIYLTKRSRPAGGNLDDGTARPGGREQDTHPTAAMMRNSRVALMADGPSVARCPRIFSRDDLSPAIGSAVTFRQNQTPNSGLEGGGTGGRKFWV